MQATHHFSRRTALGLLTTWPAGMLPRPAAASQAEVLTAAEFTDGSNTIHHLSELGRPLLLVNPWAAWCAGCLAEMPALQALATRLGRNAIDVVLLSHPMNWNADRGYARETGLPFPHWRLSSRVPETVAAAVFGMQGDRFGLPQSLVFAGPRRQLVASYLGSRDWTAPGQLRLAHDWLDAAG